MSVHSSDDRAFSFCSVPLATTVFAGPRTKEEFDRISLPATVHDWQPCKTTTLCKNDGREWERRCHSKFVETAALHVIFQWFDERPVGSAAVAGGAGQ